MANSSAQTPVLIAGAGPVGVLLALLLAREGIRSEVLEKARDFMPSPRAAGHYGPDLEVLKRTGIYDKIRAQANQQSGVMWRRRPVDDGKGGKTFGKSLGILPDFQVIIPQAKLTKIVAEEALATGLVKIHFDHEVVGLEQHADHVKISTRCVGKAETQSYTGSYLVGCDGARSSVRSLSNIKFFGHTWPERVVATDVLLKNDEVAPVQLNFIPDPESYTVIIPLEHAVVGKKTLWRYAFCIPPEEQGMTDEEILEPDYIHKKYEERMVGKRPLEYEIVQKAPYHQHQRLAGTMRRGRVLLAGDAAHLCNPLGGMGLTTGILDVEALTDALTMVLNEGHSEDILQSYSDQRRQAFGLFVDPMTNMNRARLLSHPDEVENEDALTHMLQVDGDKAVKFMAVVYQERWRTNMRARQH